MTVIRRDECAECGTPMVAGRILCPRNSEHIGRVTVEYVPRADADRGAVDALYSAHDFIGRVLKWEGDDDTEQSELLAEIAKHLPRGGQ
jgi:hypothetical protein